MWRGREGRDKGLGPSESVSWGLVEEAMERSHCGVEVPMPSKEGLFNHVRLEAEATPETLVE